MNKEKTIYDLKLHEQLKISTCIYVTRVPGGWLYDYYEDGQKTSCFVPYSDEFIQSNDKPDIDANKRKMTQIERMLVKILMGNKGAFYKNETNVINEWLKQFDDGIDYFFNN